MTAQNPGDDGIWHTDDDLVTPINKLKADVSVDASSSDDDRRNSLDRVRGFYSYHSAQGANFVFGDGSVRFLSQDMDVNSYITLSTIDSGEPVESR